MAQTSGTDIGCLDEPCREEGALPRAQALQAWGFLFSPPRIRFLIQPLSYEGDASPPLKELPDPQLGGLARRQWVCSKNLLICRLRVCPERGCGGWEGFSEEAVLEHH